MSLIVSFTLLFIIVVMAVCWIVSSLRGRGSNRGMQTSALNTAIVANKECLGPLGKFFSAIAAGDGESAESELNSIHRRVSEDGSFGPLLEEFFKSQLKARLSNPATQKATLDVVNAAIGAKPQGAAA